MQPPPGRAGDYGKVQETAQLARLRRDASRHEDVDLGF